MNEQQLTRALHYLADTRIGDEMDHWNTIQTRLNNRSVTRRQSRLLRLATVAAALVAMLFVSAGVYAFYQMLRGDDGLEGIRDAGLMTPINQTQDIDGVSVRLSAAYADTQRLVMYLRFEGDLAAHPYATHSFILRDKGEHYFSYSSAMTYEDPTANAYGIEVVFYSQVIQQQPDGEVAIDNDYLTSLEDPFLDLELYVYLSDEFSIPYPPPGETPGERADALGPFAFEFELPLMETTRIDVGETQIVNGQAVTLNTVSVAPSETRVNLCLDLPDPRDWQPVTTITIGDTVYPMSSYGLVGMPSPDDTRRCPRLTFAAFYDGQPTTLTVIVDKLQISEPDDPAWWQQVMDELAKYDIEAVAFPRRGVYFEILSQPDDMTDQEVFDLMAEIRLSLRESVAGPWVFEVEMP